MWYVYILQCSDNTYYTGVTTDIERRLIEHNSSNKGAKYTKMRRPVEMIYNSMHNSRKEACKEEYRIKKLTRKQKNELLKKEI